MAFDFCFDVAALIILVVAKMSSSRQYVEVTRKSQRFRRLLWALMLATLLDIVSTLTCTYSASVPVPLNLACNMLAYLTFVLAVYSYVTYMETYIVDKLIPKLLHRINVAVLILYCLVHIGNLFGGFLFYFDETLTFRRGDYFLLIYSVSLYYFFYGIVIMTLYRKTIGRRRYLTAMCIVPLILIATILQFGPLSHFLLIHFAIAISVILLYFNLEIPDYRQLELARREASEASRTKSEFLANMSHEIRTPMNAVVGMCELILREDDISDTVRDYSHSIQNSGRSLLSIINDILDFSKIESGKMELIHEEFDISSTLNDVINMAATRKAGKKLELIVHVDPDVPRGLIGDEVRIRQVIINLVTNAIKYSSEGFVSIRVSQTKRDYGINLSVSVTDTGIGIKEEDLEKLFSSFQQVNTRKNRSVEGTGLGLAISKRLIAQMGGVINVESVYGEGSVFRFTIPMKVSDSKPFITVKTPEHVRIAAYLDTRKYSSRALLEEYLTLLNELRRTFRIDMELFPSFEAMEAAVREKPYTHLFAAREEFIAHSAFFTGAVKTAQVVIAQDRLNAVDLPAGVKCLFKPFYALSVASILNNENVITNLDSRKESPARFIAPAARVLVVDDNAINLKVAEGLMRPYRMQIIPVESGPAAIAMLRSKDIDLVLMDHMMPDMDGVEATQAIRAMAGDYYKQLPIVALSANAVEDARKMFLASGFNDFLAKPIDVSALDRVLKTWLPKEQMLIPSGDEPESGAGPEQRVDESSLIENELFSARLGLSYLGGDPTAYFDILEKYADKGPEKLGEIRTFFEAKNWDRYVIEVHALKSASLTIGAKKLSELAKELETAGKSTYFSLIEEKNAPMLELYAQVIELARRQLAARSAPEPEQPLSEITPEELDELIRQIEAACDALDGNEVSRLCREGSLHTVAGKPLKPLFQAVDAEANDYEFDSACEKARAIPEQVKG